MFALGKWDSKKIVETARKDFEKTWLDTKELVVKDRAKKPKRKGKGKGKGRGTSNVVYDILQGLREAYIDMGFEEVINPVFIDDNEVHKQFGPEAVTVLDRCYYLGGLPRPDIGISDEKLRILHDRDISVTKEELQGILRSYKTGDIGGDDLVFELSRVLKVSDSEATGILDEVFPEFKSLKPRSSKLTLRSHMTSGWFLTLEGLSGKKAMPIQLFSIDRCFRREQKEDAGHLKTYHSASCVILDEEVGVEDGEEVAKGLLSRFGFKKFKFKLDEKRSKYYAPDTQTEVYAYNPKSKWIEVATFGVYSPIALSRYGIEYPVMNLGLGVERLAMVLYGHEDLREVVYPQFYRALSLTDKEIVGMISLEAVPRSEEGGKIAENIVEAGVKHASSVGPCEFRVYKGKLLGKNVEVKLREAETGQRLLGPAALNEVYVYDGNVYGISKENEEVKEKGVPTGIKYLDAFASLAASSIEEAVDEGKNEVSVRVKGVKLPSDINLRIGEPAMRYITGSNKRIDVRGPVFLSVAARIF
ncbi:MAG: O-phosphoserine--tRNA ligase [Candidatus Hydrothermarchaeales archaeon]